MATLFQRIYVRWCSLDAITQKAAKTTNSSDRSPTRNFHKTVVPNKERNAAGGKVNLTRKPNAKKNGDFNIHS